MGMVRRGDVWLVILDPTIGAEIQKTRPCVIISPSDMHDHLRTMLIAPMTSANKPARFRVATTFKDKAGLILLDQIRSVDKSRAIKHLGHIGDEALARTLRLLRETFMV